MDAAAAGAPQPDYRRTAVCNFAGADRPQLRSGRDAALDAANKDIEVLAQRVADRYRILLGETVTVVNVGSVSEVLYAPPPANLDAKQRLRFLR